ncbi:MAG: transposase IS116/IS110/IS902 family protein [uncultured Friedmanniella sp.]|uniref:Transposase IS116/IS110/IS902 family protein n=1 Tax=uncultured Friedmanniella sp. TaxID=335381 RepID=A0A6J4LG21_9ACTN|nr:IS110 family transposase [uncultured Friedmanniella sp.]CAA9332261.1 MAG: transposase IS116/IS110/IS902 family protein [uncultured Friedmanniella sp.]
MVVVGADVHKRTHTFVAVDEVGRELGHRTVPAETGGHQAAMRWARDRFGTDVRWAIEDCRHLSARLERDLLGAGYSVVRVPPKMMAEQRRIARTRGKSDPIDAAAVARAALREPGLPVASHDEVSRELKLLIDRRDDLVRTRTATINRLLWRVHELDPAWAPPAKSLDLAKHQRLLAQRLAGVEGIVAELARDELVEVVELTGKINALAKRIEQRTVQVAPSLLAMPGVGALTAAKIVGEAAGVARFKSEAAFARHAGIAPIPVWSGNTAGRVRLTRSGNRQLNAAVHRIAVTQIRLDGLGKTYYLKKKAEGMSTAEALRCLKRRLARVVFNHLSTDQATTATCLAAAA